MTAGDDRGLGIAKVVAVVSLVIASARAGYLYAGAREDRRPPQPVASISATFNAGAVAHLGTDWSVRGPVPVVSVHVPKWLRVRGAAAFISLDTLARCVPPESGSGFGTLLVFDGDADE